LIADELDNFLDAFVGYFPAVGTWLDKQTDLTVKAWRDSLQGIRYQAALDALASIHRGDVKPPASWDLWPAEIARQSRRTGVSTVRSFRTIDGHDVYSCLACRDTGAVCCWHPVSMRAMSNKLRGKEGQPQFGQRKTLYSCSIRCYCEEGTRRYPSWSLTYNEREWVKCDGLKDAASIERLEQFIAAKCDVRNNPAYEPAFESWSQ
jgi:hypothetical protein